MTRIIFLVDRASSLWRLTSSILRPLFLALVFPAVLLGKGAEPKQTHVCGTIAIHQMGFERLTYLHQADGLETWAEIDDVLFACAGEAGEEVFSALRANGFAVTRQWPEVPAGELFVVRGAHPGSFSLQHAGLEVLARGGPYSLVWAGDEAVRRSLAAGLLPAEAHGEHTGEHTGCGRSHVQPFTGQKVLARQEANRPTRLGTVFGPEAEQAANAVDGGRWFGDVTTLAGWNRYTHGSELPMARDWLVGQLSALPGLTVSTQSFQVGGTTTENVIGLLPGTNRADDWVLVGGHYDATSQNPSVAAPGAEDNASGCAGVLELARVLSAMPPEATVLFLCYSGEEQGLFGSADHASRLVNQGDAAKVVLMLNMDMIGYTGDVDLDCLLETDTPFADLLDPFADAAAAFTQLRIVTSLFAFGSDHVPYLQRNIPALLTIENDWDSYPSYHRTSDLPQNVSQQMGYEVLRMNAAVLAHVAGASNGEPPLFADGFESGDTAGWTLTVIDGAITVD